MIRALALSLALSLSAGGGAPDPLPWDGQSYRRHADPVARVAFPVPLTQALVEARHFPGAAAGQMTDLFTLSGPEAAELEIGVWRNPAGLPLSEWIRSYSAFLLSPEGVELAWHATPAHLDARLFEHPRTGQQWARRTAVFAAEGRMVRVTCLNRDDPRSAALFEQVLERLEVGR